MLIFLKNPEKFICASLPTHLPSQRTYDEVKDKIPKSLEFKGNCPVTLFEGPPGFDSIVLGRNDLIIDYGDKLYCFLDENKLNKFMKTPEIYADQKLPTKLPPRKGDIPVTDLPLIAFLESSVAGVLNQALIAVGTEKPKYPFNSLSKSASQYLALYLNG